MLVLMVRPHQPRYPRWITRVTPRAHYLSPLTDPHWLWMGTDAQCIVDPSVPLEPSAQSKSWKMFNFFGSDGSVIQSDHVCKFKHCDATRALTILESGKSGNLASQQAGRCGKNPAKRFDWLTDASAKTTPPSVSHAFPHQSTDACSGHLPYMPTTCVRRLMWEGVASYGERSNGDWPYWAPYPYYGSVKC